MLSKLSTKISLNDYFIISSILTKTKENNFLEYKKERNYDFDKINKFSELLKLKEYYLKTNKCESTIVNHIKGIETRFLWSIFVLSIIYGMGFLVSNLNINLFIIVYILIPIVIMLITATKMFKYKYSQLDESESFLSTFFKFNFENSLLYKLFISHKIKMSENEFSKENSHVLKALSLMIFQKLGIVFSIGLCIGIAIYFFVVDLRVFSEGSLSNGTEVTEFFVTSLSSPWAFFASYGIPSPDIIKNSANIETSLEHKSDWVKFILMSIFFWLCLGRILLYFYAKRILNKVINNSLLNESEFFFNCIRQSVKMKLPEESLVKSININENRDIFNINNYNDYSILCYRIAKVDIKRIKVDLNNSFLKDKVIRSQDSFSLYGKEKEEESMISSLANIVLIFINPVSNPDESFKNKLKKILSFNIQKIWIIPLIEENEYYKMMNNGHMKYKNWKKLTKEFKEVSLFNE